MNKPDKHKPCPVTLSAVMEEMQKEDRPVNKHGKPLTDSRLQYRESARRQRTGGPHTFFNIVTGKCEPLR